MTLSRVNNEERGLDSSGKMGAGLGHFTPGRSVSHNGIKETRSAGAHVHWIPFLS